MFVTQEQRVVVFCHLSSYSETLILSEPSQNNKAEDCPLSQSTKDSNSVGKVLRFFPSDGRYEIDGILTIKSILWLEQHDEYAPSAEAYQKELKVHGLVGILDLHFGKYLFYIKEREWVGANGDKNIFRVVSGHYITIYREPYLTLTQEQHENEAILGILEILSSGTLYFSYDYDLTNSSQKFMNKLKSFSSSQSSSTTVFLCHLANPDYWWNRHLQRPFLKDVDNFKEFILPIICGYVGHIATIVPFTRRINGESVTRDEDLDVLLIARMRSKRAGTRYTRRGIDVDGNAAVQVETELIAKAPQKCASHVQIRASVPWFWCQIPDMRYKPTLHIEPETSPEAIAGIESHFSQLEESYGKFITCFNLLDCQGFEAPLSEIYTKKVQSLMEGPRPALSYHKFDLNPKFPGLGLRDLPSRTKALKTIAEIAYEDGMNQGIFLASLKSSKHSSKSQISNADEPVTILSVIKTQSGVFRTNCLDCLDRTNMIQFIIACSCLISMLKSLGVEIDVEKQSEFAIADLEKILGEESVKNFREIWIDHGDGISRQYTGTCALHSNFIKSGKSFNSLKQRGQIRRKIRDGFLSVARFYLNQFIDPFRQDSIDIFLGYHRGSLDGHKYPPLSAAEFCSIHQELQRQQSFSMISLFNDKNPGYSSVVNAIATHFTAYLLLYLRHFAPHFIRSTFDYVVVFFTLFVIFIWWILFGKSGRWNIIRYPKSGSRCWEGDEVPLRLISKHYLQ